MSNTGEHGDGLAGQQRTPPWWSWTALTLSVAGFGIALYLTVDHFTGTLPSCPATGIVNCAKVTTSAQSSVFGVPVALAGLIFFTVMLVANVPPAWRSTLPAVAWVRLVMAVGGMGFVVYLLYAELFLIKAICLWCTAVHVVTFLVFLLVVATFPSVLAESTVPDG
ncbi:MAG: vitamin K epoxide reductase family protein [Acidimicrobiales bacterium]